MSYISYFTSNLNSPDDGIVCNEESIKNKFITERELIRDLIYVLQGIDGIFLKISSDSETMFKLMYEEATISGINKQKIVSIANAGFLYQQINLLIEKFKEPSSGKFFRCLATAISKELNDFLKFLAHIDSLLNDNVFETRNKSALTLTRMLALIYQPRSHLELLLKVCSFSQSKQNENPLSYLYGLYYMVCAHDKIILSKIILTSTYPLYTTLKKWLLYGILDDPYHEFFICSIVHVENKLAIETIIKEEPFKIQKELIPSFMEESLANKCFSAGMSVHLLKTLGKLENFEKNDFGTFPEQIITNTIEISAEFEAFCNKVYEVSNKMVIDAILNKQMLKSHILMIKRYIFLSQSDFAYSLIEAIDFCSKSSQVKIQSKILRTILINVVKRCSARDESLDFINRISLNVVSTKKKAGKWDIYKLHYSLENPMTIICQESDPFGTIYKLLWKFRWHHHLLVMCWKKQREVNRINRSSIRSVKSVYILANVINSRLMHFVKTLLFYFYVQGVEPFSSKLFADLDQAHDLQSLRSSFSDFLINIKECLFLTSEKCQSIAPHLTKLLYSIINYIMLHYELISNFNAKSAEITKEANLHDKLCCFANEYDSLMQKFLLVLQEHPCRDMSLRYLAIMIDYNKYYSNRSLRLRSSITFKALKNTLIGEDYTHDIL